MRTKSADWTEKETLDLLQAWGPKYEKLRSASQRVKIALWNEIYSTYKECHLGSTTTELTLVQVKKKRQKNLEYELPRILFDNLDCFKHTLVYFEFLCGRLSR